MRKKSRPPQAYKTESQLKEEARIKQAAEAEASAAVQKSALRKKHENFWYHYKWQTVASVAAAAFLLFFIKDMFFRTKPDATVIVVSESYFGDYERSFITSRLNGCATDFNGDKSVYIATDFISLPKPDNGAGQSDALAPDLTGGQGEMANAMKLMAVLSVNSDPIYLLDEAAYNYITSMTRPEDAGEPASIFEDFSVPAEKGEGAGFFKDMRFYLRAAYSDENYQEYCRQILKEFDRS